MDVKNSLILLIPAAFVLLFALPVFVEVRLTYNPLLNRGVVALFIFRKNVLYYFFSVHGRYIELQNEKETKTKEIQFESKKFAVLEEFGRQLKDKIKLKKIYVFYNIGAGDAALSALLCGVLNQVLTLGFVFVKSKKPTASLCVYDTVSYNKEIFELATRGQISISLFDVVYSFIYSVIITSD
jgi:hypothetical protein